MNLRIVRKQGVYRLQIELRNRFNGGQYWDFLERKIISNDAILFINNPKYYEFSNLAEAVAVMQKLISEHKFETEPWEVVE